MSATVRREVAFAFCLTVAALPYLSSVGGPYLIDDRSLIEHNPAVHDLGAAAKWFGEFFPHSPLEARAGESDLQYFRPLVLLSYALNWAMGQGAPLVFHLTNLLLHALASGLVYLTLLRWTKGAVTKASVGCLIYAWHPAQTESVAWISGRTDSWLMVGVGVTLLGHELWFQARKFVGLLAFALGICIAFASKEAAVMLWATLAAQLVLGDRSRDVRAWGPAVCLLALSGCYLVARSIWLPMRALPAPALDFLAHLQLVLHTLGRAATLLLFPFDLSFFQAPLRSSVGAAGATYAVFGGAFLLSCLLSSLWLWRHNRRAAVGLLLGLALLLPTLQIVPTTLQLSFSPRCLSFPLLGFALLGAESILALGEVWKSGASQMGSVPKVRFLLRYGPAVCLLAVLCACSARRSEDWGNRDRFWAREQALNHGVPTVVFRAARNDEENGHSWAAYRRLVCGYHRFIRDDRAAHAPFFLRAALRVGESELKQPTYLPQFAEFLGRLLSHRPARLQALGATLRYSGTKREGALLQPFEQDFAAAYARMLARLGDPHAPDVALRAARECLECREVVKSSARVLLVLGRETAALGLMQQAGISQVRFLGKASFSLLLAQDRSLRQQVRLSSRRRGQALLQRALLLHADNQALALLRSHPQLRKVADPLAAKRLASWALRAADEELALAMLQENLPALQVSQQMASLRAFREHSQESPGPLDPETCLAVPERSLPWW